LARVSAIESQLNPTPAVAQELAALNREYEAAKQRYNYLSDKKLSSEMAARVDASENNETFKVLDEAYLPMFPVSPNRPLLALVGCAAGLICGLGAAFGREFLDSTLHTEADAAAELNLPILGGIPNIQGKIERKAKTTLGLPELAGLRDEKGRAKFYLKLADSKIRDIIMNPFAPAGEPYRLMHAKLLAMQKRQAMKTILVTSAVPGEGKTFAATCLAGVLARESGKRVLLIDADLRTGNAGRMLGFGEKGIGLVELLDEAADLATVEIDVTDGYPECEVLPNTRTLERSIVQCSEVNMHLLPSGTSRNKPAHLLNTPRLEGLLRQAELLYDWIIIDSPPVLALADANVLAPLCDGTVVVVRTGKTPAAAVKEAIRRIGTERICGLLMNRTRGGHSSYYYGSYFAGERKD
jgi:Mrp family chromosome partitioning ATPase